MTASADATQLSASDPHASAFVSAHAGTGKTKLLIDRLLRLMLAGADPARILCLTYTKAAAAEMAIRLQRRLGAWVAMPDAALDTQLAALDVAATHHHRQAARALFAQVLDLPGGMRIGTIHAFCQSLLRRFPLEAAISPHFQLVDAAEARAELEIAREAALPRADPAALATLAGLVSADGFAALVANLEADRHRLVEVLALPAAARLAGLQRAAGLLYRREADIVAAAIAWPDEAPLRAQIELAANRGSDGVKTKAHSMLGWLGLPPDLRLEHWTDWVGEFFRTDGEPRGLGVFANKKLAELHPTIIPACAAEQARIEQIADQQRAWQMTQATAAMLELAAPILGTYEAAKERRALVDYNDLIGRTETLLRDHGAAWVLFKLDGGLDHLLLDEVQDTAPSQWTIADRLTADFFTGQGARHPEHLARTVFAVGDRKQSIYSFQGADPAEFDRWRETYGQRVSQAGLPWRATQLDVSFRSTAQVLALVDAVAAATGPGGGILGPADPAPHHIPSRRGSGRVDLWPLTPRPDSTAHTPWSVPDRNQAQTSAPQTLVGELAAWIADQTTGRSAIRPGDILILVRRRGDFDRALVRALKDRDVPVAGLDRMVLTEQPAVQDLVALCNALLLPTDDLTFAELLTSPLGGLTDESLMELAPSRSASLWDALRSRAGERADWQAAADFFATLLSRVDYAQPYALLTEALGPLGGRARLFARLGPQAAEPVDELLAASLVHAAGHPPSLQGFLHWLTLSAAEVKREAEAAGDAVRIMTVHGSKGLESSLVILPDTTGLPPDDRGLCWATDPGTGMQLPLWQPGKHLRSEAVETMRAEGEAARRREYNRLLYVALTRARDRLLICGWQPHKQQPGSWYEIAAAALRSLGATASPFTAWPGEALTLAGPDTDIDAGRTRAAAAQPEPLPSWAGSAPEWRPEPLAAEPALPSPLAPSRPDGIELGRVPPARSPLAATGHRNRFNRGLAMHTLLQHLPDIGESDRADAAYAYAARPSHALEQPDEIAAEALAILADPALAGLFGPGSRAEQPLSGLVAGRIVSGQVDRLAILPDRIIIADYKTNRDPPAGPADVPVLYLRQMAAYRAVLVALYPARPVTCLLIWTDGPVVMQLPGELLDVHDPARREAAGP